jgi:hypothetical protein
MRIGARSILLLDGFQLILYPSSGKIIVLETMCGIMWGGFMMLMGFKWGRMPNSPKLDPTPTSWAAHHAFEADRG